MYHKPYLFVFLFFAYLGCTEQTEFQTHSSSANYAQFSITTKGSPASFSLKVNETPFPLDSQSLVAQVEKLAQTAHLPIHQAAWQFVSNQTVDAQAPANDTTFNLYAFVSSQGYGLCHNRAMTLAALWQVLGFESRVCYLNGHVVSEVKINDYWEMFDADHEAFYVDSIGRVTSAQDLHNMPTLITSPFSILTDTFEIDEFSDTRKHQALTASIFAASEHITYEIPESHTALSTHYELPAEAKLIFPVMAPYQNHPVLPLHSFAKLVLYPSKETQLLRIPLHLNTMEGNAQLEPIPTGDGFQWQINDIQDSVSLFFLINPRLEATFPVHQIDLEGPGVTSCILKSQAKLEQEVNPLFLHNFVSNWVYELPENHYSFLDINDILLTLQTDLVNQGLALPSMEDDLSEIELHDLLSTLNKENFNRDEIFYLLMIMLNNSESEFKEQIKKYLAKLEGLEEAL